MRKTAILILAAALAGCTGQEIRKTGDTSGERTVFLSADGLSDKTKIGRDGLNCEWTADDRLCVWAYPQGSSVPVLNRQVFTVYGSSKSAGVFTSVLDRAMPKGTYDYLSCCPEPFYLDGETASFHLSPVQDGRGDGIIIGRKTSYGALTDADSMLSGEHLNLEMVQKLHLLKFWYPAEEAVKLDGESIQKIEITFPKPVVGTIKASLSACDKAAELSEGENKITINVAGALEPSLSSSDRIFAYAQIAPTQFGEGDRISIKLYTETHVAMMDGISLSGRNFRAGHATPIRLNASVQAEHCKVYFDFSGNNIGEPVKKITIKASGAKWGDNGTDTYVIESAGGIAEGSSYNIEYNFPDAFRTLSGKTATVEFETEHAAMTRTVSIPDLSGVSTTRIALTPGWLLFEDFSTVPQFSSHDEHKTSSAGSKSAYTFLNGWSGGRIGSSAGNSIRTACRRETSVDYHARVDTAPLSGRIRKVCKLKVEFDYGSNNKFEGIPIVTDGNVGQNCYIGYTNSTTAYDSGDESGTFDRNINTFYTKEYTGSWTNTPNHAEYILSGVKAADITRIAIRTEVEHQAGTTNTTAWLYIDNVKVTICQ